MKNKFFIPLMFLMLMFALVGCGKTVENNDFKGAKTFGVEIKNKYANVNQVDGSFTIAESGVINSGTAIKAPVTIDVYFDPMCPGCQYFEQKVSPRINELVESGEAVVVYHPLMFLYETAPEYYSQRAAAITIGIAEYSPENAAKFLSLLMSEEFAEPEFTKKVITNQELYELAKSAGVSDETISKIDNNLINFAQMTYNMTDMFINDTTGKYAKISTTGSAYTPFIVVNKTGESTAKALALDSNDPLAEFEEALTKALK